MRAESLKELLSLFPDIDGFWNSDDLPTTETRIRDRLNQESSNDEKLKLLTLLAKALALQSKLPEAGATLLLAKELFGKGPTLSKNELRWLIEQGRFYGLSMNPTQSIPSYEKAWTESQKSKDTYCSIEAAVMMSVSQPPKYQNQWLTQALKLAEASDEKDCKLWLPQLYAMSGWHAFDFRKFDEALGFFKRAAELIQDAEPSSGTLGIRWGLGRVLRALSKNQEALEIQRSIMADLESVGLKNGHVFLEVAENLQTLRQDAEAKGFFEQAYKELSLHGWYVDNKASELARIQHLSKQR